MITKDQYKLLIENANLFYNGYTINITDKQYDELLDLQLNVNPKFNIFDHISLLGDNENHLLPYDKIDKIKITNILLII